MTWLQTIKARVDDARRDPRHRITWANAPRFTTKASKDRIVDFYEDLYVELAESVAGLEGEVAELKRVREQDAETIRNRDHSIEWQEERLRTLEFRVAQLARERNGLVHLIGQVPIPREPAPRTLQQALDARDFYGERRA